MKSLILVPSLVLAVTAASFAQSGALLSTVEAEHMGSYGTLEVREDVSASGRMYVQVAPTGGGFEFQVPGDPSKEYQLFLVHRGESDAECALASATENVVINCEPASHWFSRQIPEFTPNGGQVVVIDTTGGIDIDCVQVLELCACKISEPDRDSNIIPLTNEWLLPGLSILTSLDLFIHSTTYEVPVEFDRTSENIIAQRQGVCDATEECPAIQGCSAEFRIRARRLETQVNWFNVATGNSASQSGYNDRELEEDFWKTLRAKAEGKSCPATIEAKIKIFDCTYTITWTCKNCSRS
jgi:hypothetical protein